MAKEVLEMEVKSNIGELSKDTQAIIEAIKGAKKETKELSKETEGVGKSSAKSVSGVKKLTGAFGGLMKSLGIIGLIAAAFTALKEALERNQKVMDVVNTIMTTISTTFNQVVEVLTDTYEWVTKSSDRFDGLGKVLSGLVTLSLTPLKLAFFGLKLGVQEVQLAWEKWMGGADPQKMAELRGSIVETRMELENIAVAAIDAGKDIGNNIGDAIGEIGAIGEMAIEGISKISIKSNYELAKATTAAANSSKLAEAQIQGLIEKYDRQAELQRQIRDDETKTFAERIAANKKLGEILDEQETEMLKLADTRVAAAALELSANESNIDLQVAYQQALNDRAGVEAQVSGFRSEQLTNEVSLNKELLESQKEIRAEGLAGMEQELQELQDAYDLKVEMARKAGMDIAEITEKYEKEKGDIVESYQKKVVKWSEMSSEQQLGIASSAAGDMAKILGEETEAGRAMAVVQATIDTYASAQAAYNSLAGIPVVGPVLGGIAAAAAVAMGMKNIQAIKSANSGGGGGGNNPPPAPSPPAPQMMSGAFDISGGIEPEATKAYVVTDEMSNSQNQLANIRRRATI